MEALDREEDDNFGPDDHLQRVLGEERSGRVRCRPGKTIAPTTYWGTSSSSSSQTTQTETIKALIEERERNKSFKEQVLKALEALTPSVPEGSAAAFNTCVSTIRSFVVPQSTSYSQQGDGGDNDDDIDRGDEGGDGDDDDHGDDGAELGDDEPGDDSDGDVDPLHF